MSARSHSANRRSFLQSTTAAAAFPTIIASTALGKDGRGPANDRISVGIIGTGKMCHGYHLNSLLGYEDVQIAAICEVDKNRRDSAMRKIEAKYATKSGHKGCDETTDFREILSRDDIDAVLIATPDHWHAIPIIEACKAGKDVYCEKPLTLTILEAQRCIEAARKYDRVVQTGSQQRSSVFGPFRKACEFVRSGRIGKIRTVTVGVGGPSKWCDLPAEDLEPGLDWNMWLGQAPDRPYTLR
jgi:predicted dehydrogenase